MTKNDRSASGGSPPQSYERYFVPAIGAPLAKDLVDVAALREGERVLDVACGTGVVARLAAQKVGEAGSVAGLDVNPGMLAVARAATPSGTTIDWHEASAESMPLPDEYFDVALCQMGLQFVPDKNAALAEVRRVLAPGGRLVLSVPGPIPDIFAVLADALARHVGAPPAGFVQQVFSLHDEGQIRDLVESAGFGEVSVRPETRSLELPPPEDFLWQYVDGTPLAPAVAKAGEEARGALGREVVAGWREHVIEGSFRLEVRMVLVTARR